MRGTLVHLFALLGLVSLPLLQGGCTSAPAHLSATWISGRTAPAFDPDGPPDALRWALERQLSLGLVERDSAGQVRLGLADSIGCSGDSLVWTFRLRPNLHYTDGSPIGSSDIRQALLGGLGREDHASSVWLLSAIRGVASVRAGGKLPRLGIRTPDARRLVLELERPDRRLLEKLSVPGVSTPWKRRTGDWREAVGVGPYRILTGDSEQSLTLVSTGPVANVAPLVDTLRVRFATGAARVRSILRLAHADLVWPLPPGLRGQPLFPGWSLESRTTEPARRLLLVLRADLPPLQAASSRRALARAIDPRELLSILGQGGAPLRLWPPGARSAFRWPGRETLPELTAMSTDSSVNESALDRRHRSYRVALAYDADLSGAEIAPRLQGQWARAGHYADLRPLQGRMEAEQQLAPRGAPAQLVECQAMLTGPEAELAQLVTPIGGLVVGSFRTGWRTRDYDRWIAAPEPAPGFDPDAVARRLSTDCIVLPLASLPWRLALRAGGTRPVLHPAFGPGWTVPNPSRGDAKAR